MIRSLTVLSSPASHEAVQSIVSRADHASYSKRSREGGGESVSSQLLGCVTCDFVALTCCSSALSKYFYSCCLATFTTCRPEDLKDIAERFGEVRDVYIPRNYYTQQPRGFAFIEFNDAKACEEASYDMQGLEIEGQAVRAAFAGFMLIHSLPEQLQAPACQHAFEHSAHRQRRIFSLGLLQFAVWHAWQWIAQRIHHVRHCGYRWR